MVLNRRHVSASSSAGKLALAATAKARPTTTIAPQVMHTLRLRLVMAKLMPIEVSASRFSVVRIGIENIATDATNDEIAAKCDCATRTVERKLERIRRIWDPSSEAD